MTAVAVVALTSGTALATGGYSARVSTATSVATGAAFTVKSSGTAAQKALLYVYLDHKSCTKTWLGEASRVGRYEAGRSYFSQGHRNETWIYAWVTGSFEKSFTAHAGDTAEREHACAYLATPNSYGGYRVNAARGATDYTVTAG